VRGIERGIERVPVCVCVPSYSGGNLLQALVYDATCFIPCLRGPVPFLAICYCMLPRV
jgi:hypothetical protein